MMNILTAIYNFLSTIASAINPLGQMKVTQYLSDGTESAPVEYADAISEGLISGKVPFSAMGERSSIGATVQGEDMWEGVAAQVPIPAGAGEQMSIVSSAVEDNGTSATGILTMRIYYLDVNGDEQSEDITIDGQTPVHTIATDITFVNDFYALTVGSNGVAEGIIIIYKFGSAATIYNTVRTGGNKSLVINRKIPTGKTLYITEWSLAESKDKESSYRLRSNCTPDGSALVGGFLFKRSFLVKKAAVHQEIHPPIKICAGAIVKVSAWATGAGGTGSASFNGYLKDD